jgi:DNA mismatch endonuclease, patch repair protein
VKRHKYKTRLVNPPPTSEAVRHSMQANRAKDTKPELQLRKSLWSCGFRGYRLHSKTVPGRPDISFGKQKVAVFVHGCFWHRCPKCRFAIPRNNRKFWITKFRRNRARDKRKRHALEQLGWQVRELWECEIQNSMVKCLQSISRSLSR